MSNYQSSGPLQTCFPVGRYRESFSRGMSLKKKWETKCSAECVSAVIVSQSSTVKK